MTKTSLEEEILALDDDSRLVREGAALALGNRTGACAMAAAQALWDRYGKEPEATVKESLFRSLAKLLPDADIRRLQLLLDPFVSTRVRLHDEVAAALSSYETDTLPVVAACDALAGVSTPSDAVVGVAQRCFLPGDERLRDLLVRAVWASASVRAWAALTHPPGGMQENDWYDLARRLIDSGFGRSIALGHRCAKRALRSADRERIPPLLLKALLRAQTSHLFRSIVNTLAHCGYSGDQVVEYLIEHADDWELDTEGGVWAGLWPLVGTRAAELFDKLARRFRKRHSDPGYVALHEMLLERKHGIPDPCSQVLAAALCKNIWSGDRWPRRRDARFLPRMVSSGEALHLDRKLTEKMLRVPAAADAAVKVLQQSPDDGVLAPMATQILASASRDRRLEALLHWPWELLRHADTAVFSAIRACYNGNEEPVIRAWGRAIREGGYALTGLTEPEEDSEAPEQPVLLWICRGKVGLRSLLLLDPVPAREVLALAPWLRFLDCDSMAGRTANWILAGAPGRSDAQPALVSLQKIVSSLPGWKWDDAFAVRLPTAALPTLAGGGLPLEVVKHEVMLLSAPVRSIPLMKEIRLLTRMSLRECWDLAQAGEGRIMIAADEMTASQAAHRLRALGATVAVRPCLSKPCAGDAVP